MTPARLLAYFDRIGEASGAVPKLRQFILELAVRGKLVAQDSNDEPADVLLRNIEAEKKRLTTNSNSAKGDTQRYLSGENEYFEIPKSWVWTRLGDIGRWGSGSTPPRGHHEYFGGDVTWLKSGELNDNEALAGSEETVTKLALVKCSFRLNQPGDVLFAMYGATIGKVAILAESAVTNQAVVGCTPFAGVDNRYLFKFLQSQRARFHQASEGGAQPNVSKEKMIRCPFPLPPLAEQRRIVAKVDELMALCDELEAAQAERERRRDRLAAASLARLNQPADDREQFRRHVRFHLDHLGRFTTRPNQIPTLRQTILNLAIRGALVSRCLEDRPACESLEAIDAERRQIWEAAERAAFSATGRKPKSESWKDKYEPANPEVVNVPFSLPTHWTWVRFDSLVAQYQYGPRFGNDEYVENGTPTVRTSDMDFRGTVSLASAPKVRIPHVAERHWCLQQDDLLVTRTGATIGKTALYDESWGRAVASAYLIRFRFTRRNCNARFLQTVFMSPFGRELLLGGATAMAQPNVNATSICNFPFPLPPLAEQERIVAKVDELMAICDELESHLTTAETDRRRLFEAVLHEALEPAA